MTIDFSPSPELRRFLEDLTATGQTLPARLITDLHDVEEVVQCLANDRVALFFGRPTHGLAARGTSRAGVERIYRIKGRNYDKPLAMICHRENIEKWAMVGPSVRSTVEAITRRYWPGPLSIVLPKRMFNGAFVIPEWMTAGIPTVNLMCPDEVSECLGRAAPFPIAATSANYSGAAPVLDPVEGIKLFGRDVDIMLLGPQSDIGVSTTILDLTERPFRILRPGPVSWSELCELIPDLTPTVRTEADL